MRFISGVNFQTTNFYPTKVFIFNLEPSILTLYYQNKLELITIQKLVFPMASEAKFRLMIPRLLPSFDKI